MYYVRGYADIIRISSYFTDRARLIGHSDELKVFVLVLVRLFNRRFVLINQRRCFAQRLRAIITATMLDKGLCTRLDSPRVFVLTL